MPGALSSIIGLGKSELSRSPIGSARSLAATALQSAIANAGLETSAIDGLLINQSSLAPAGTLPLQMMDDVGLSKLRLLSQIEGKGASVLQMVHLATMAIRQGMASAVACVFADAPLVAGQGGGQSYQNEAPLTGIAGWEGQYGLYGPAASYALATQRYMHDFQVGESTLAQYPIACRKWAARNPAALMKKPLDLEGYLAARYIAEPIRMFDCAYPVNGGIAVIVSSVDAARDTPNPGVYVHGMGQGHSTIHRLAGHQDEHETAGSLAAKGVYGMAGVTPAEVTVCQFYDAFSFCAVAALEDYGLCERGEGAAFIASGATSPGGELPVNTGGGHLASYYMQGMTPLEEAIVQARAHGGDRQVGANDLILVNGSGGRLEYHAAVLLSPHLKL
ncbi:MAG: thiolase family protein [Pseudomonadota bacterium]